MGIKSLFGTPKKTVISVLCGLLIVAVVGAGCIFAANQLAEGNAIGAENAKNFAFADAGIDPVSAKAVRCEFEREFGQFVYDVEFIADGVEYEYWIKSSDGTVVKKETEIIGVKEERIKANISITPEKARQAALTDAGVNSADVNFIKSKPDVDDGVTVYEIEFYANDVKYEYDINADTGAIVSKSSEAVMKKNPQQGTQVKNPQKKPQNQAPAQQQSQPSQQGNQVAQPQQPAQQNQNPPVNNGGTDIGLESAKSRALSHAGVSAADVRFVKAKADYDDGRKVYDIEFRKGNMEYEYEIDASTGNILEYDSEWDD